MNRIALACCLMLCAAFADAQSDLNGDLRLAAAAETQGDHATAERLFSRVLGAEGIPAKQRALIYFARGNARGNNGAFQAAIDDFTAALRLDATLWDAYYNRGLINSDIGNYPAALLDLYAVENLAGNYPTYYFNRGYMHFENEDYDQAIADLTIAAQAAPKKTAIYYQRAKAYEAKSDRQKAMADFSKVIELKPAESNELSAAYRWRGTQAFALKRYDEAIADFSALLKLNPNDADGAMRRAYADYSQGRYADTVADASRVIASRAAPGAVFPWPGVIDPAKIFADRIVDQYNSGMRLPGIDPYALVIRARAYLKLGRKEEALADYAAAVRVIPAGADDSVAAEMNGARR